MSTETRLNSAFNGCLHLSADNSSRFVFMSDVHRGIGDGADDFSQNSALWHAAMEHYWREGYTYFELGDGDELWENRRFHQILKAHREVFAVMERFYRANRLYMLYGNHDIMKRDEKWRKKNLQGCLLPNSRICVPIFNNLQIHEAIVLDGADGKTYCLCHGNQGDFFNSTLWRFSRAFVHTLWAGLQIFGMREPFRTSQNPDKLHQVDQKLEKWAEKHGCILIAGHTHRPYLGSLSNKGYVNDGCCIHPGEINAVEMINGKLQLVQWSVRSRADGVLYAGRTVL